MYFERNEIMSKWTKKPCLKDGGSGNSFDVYGDSEDGQALVFCVEPWNADPIDCDILLAAPEMYEVLEEIKKGLRELMLSAEFDQIELLEQMENKAQSILSRIGGEDES
jgi:hypothetical protein